MIRYRPLIRPLLVGGIVLLLVTWGCGELIRSYATLPDQRAVLDLASVRTPGLTSASKALSLVGSGYVVYPLAVVASLALFALRRLAGALLVLVGTFGATIIENLDKLLVARPRPPGHHLMRVTSYSFPSGHATQSTALYGGLLLAWLFMGPTPVRGRSRSPLRLLAALATILLVAAICFSRIYLGVHYPTDVAAGAVLSLLWLSLVRRTVLSEAAARAPRSDVHRPTDARCDDDVDG